MIAASFAVSAAVRTLLLGSAGIATVAAASTLLRRAGAPITGPARAVLRATTAAVVFLAFLYLTLGGAISALGR